MNKINKLLISLFLAFSFLISAFGFVYAGTDLTITCFNEGLCDIAPASTPLFYETNMMPGDELQQNLLIINEDTNEACNLILNTTDKTSGQTVNLAQRIFAAINDGSTSYFGTLLPSGRPSDAVNYQNLYDATNISLGSLAANSSRTYTWYADFDFTADNEFQRSQSVFDLDINIRCGTEPNPSNGSVAGSSGEGFSNPGPASPPVCHDSKPSAAPVLEMTELGPNAVQLTWTAVSPVTHYALEFYRLSDGAPYGAANIGNVTSYTVTNLSGGGASYRFFIRPINGCMPGDLSNESAFTPTGGIVSGRPIGEGEQVLGATDAKSESQQAQEPEGSILGESTCSTWKWYIPWILLIAQGFLVLVIDYYLRQDEKYTKHYLAIGVTLASIVIFYLVRECNCYGDAWWFFAWLCKWYFIISILLTLVLKAINYAFIEETEVKPSISSAPNKDSEEKKST